MICRLRVCPVQTTEIGIVGPCHSRYPSPAILPTLCGRFPACYQKISSGNQGGRPMRRTMTFSAALAAFGCAAAFAIAQEQDVPCPPTFTAPSSGTTGPDYYQASGHAFAAAPVTSPMILQLGPPPAMYSPSADFKARVAALAFDDCAVPPPAPSCPPPPCPPLSTLPGTTQ